jgi:hypothetical protein
MKTLQVITPHSYVSLITNSSSELFVCDTKRTIEAVKQTIEAMYVPFYETSEHKTETYPRPPSELWTEMFQEPKIAEYDFNWYGFPVEMRDKYESFYGTSDIFNRYTFSVYSVGIQNKKVQKLREKAYSIIREKSVGLPDGLPYKERHEIEEKVFRSFNNSKFKAWKDLVVQYLKNNGFSESSMPLFKISHTGEYCRFTCLDGDEDVMRAFEFFDFCMCWRADIKKGQILLYSQSDNTVPFDFFGVIESLFHAERYHLG